MKYFSNTRLLKLKMSGIKIDRAILSLFFCGVLLVYSTEKDLPKRQYIATRSDSLKPIIDGHLDDACWLDVGNWNTDFTQYLPEEGAKASQQTEFKILFDNHYLYFSYRALDAEPEKIAPLLARRDALVGDMGGFALDSHFNHRTAYEFNMTAAGAKIDIAHLDSGSEWIWDTAWDAVYEGKSALEDSAWTFEMRVPFSQLRFPEKENHIWGMHVWRWIHRLQEESQWQLLPRTGQGGVHYFGELHGISGIHSPKRIELMPYVRGQVESFKKEAGNPFADGFRKQGAMGLDGKIGFGSNVTLDFTFNPDFGQVEADPSEVNLKSYETRFSERRPFFVEGRQSVFHFSSENQMLYYSRRIGKRPSFTPAKRDQEYRHMPDNTTILNALKLTGRSSSGWVYGFLQSTTSAEKAKIYNDGQYRYPMAEPLSNYLLGRILKEYNQGQTVVGGILTAVNRKIDNAALEFLPTAAYTGGFDVKHQFLNRTWYGNLNIMGSYLTGSENAMTSLQMSGPHYYQRPDTEYLTLDTTRTSLSGHGGRIEIGKGGGSWTGYARFGWTSPGLELNDFGYLPWTDIVNQQTRITYRQTQPVGLFRNYQLSLTRYNEWNYNKEFTYSQSQMRYSWSFMNRYGGQVSVSYIDRALELLLLRGGPLMRGDQYWRYQYFLNTDASQPLQVTFSHAIERFNHGGSRMSDYSGDIRWRITNALNTSWSVAYTSRIKDLQYVGQLKSGSHTRYLLGRIDQETLSTTFRMNWSLTPDLSIQYFGQPFISNGKYDHFRYVSNPRADAYDDRFHYYSDSEMVEQEGSTLLAIDENIDGELDYEFNRPDFKVREFLSNLVIRWEYSPGSACYLVWSQTRNAWLANGHHSIGDDLNGLFSVQPHHIFLFKMSYWFTM